jgi:molecular chaperone Hsp33
MPVEGEANLAGTDRAAAAEMDVAEQYNRIAHLAATLTAEELLTLDAPTILHRLFWEETLRYFEPATGATGPQFACSCSRERVASMLRSLGKEEIDSIVVEQGQVEIGCDFCGERYHFDPIDAAELFRDGADVPPGSQRLQ